LFYTLSFFKVTLRKNLDSILLLIENKTERALIAALMHSEGVYGRSKRWKQVMIDLRKIGEKCVWPNDLEPNGYGDLHVEDFSTWWSRNRDNMKNLPEALAEQWIYRHWTDSVASFIPIEGIRCEKEVWPPIDFITKVGTVRGNEPLDPENDFEVFSGRETGDKLQTAKALDIGHWDYPLVVLRTPGGFIDCIGDHIKTQYFLVEGHKRRRYLNALLNQGKTLKNQEVFVLHAPDFSCAEQP